MINKSFIQVKSSWGQDIHNLFLTHSPKADSIVILFPGGDGSCDKPILHYARKAALLSGCDVLSLEYGYFRTNNSFRSEFFEQTIKELNETINICLSNNLYKNVYFISKSLGTSIAGEISKIIGYDKVNNLFLTPTVKTIPHIINSKCTVIVGTNDKYFPKEFIDRIGTYPTVDLHIINNAVHSLEADDSYKESIEILSTVAGLCESFVRKENERCK